MSKRRSHDPAFKARVPADAERASVFGGHHGLVRPQDAGLAHLKHA